MKTKLHKKSLAAGLAALVLSTGAFLGASMLVSQDAEAECDISVGPVTLKCVGEAGKCDGKDVGINATCSGLNAAELKQAVTEN